MRKKLIKYIDMKKIILLLSLALFCVASSFAQKAAELSQAYRLFSEGTNDSYKNAINLYKKYETELDGEQLNLFAMCYWKLEDYKPALLYFEQSAAKGYDMGVFNAGYNYFNGNGTDKDYHKAYDYLIKLNSNFNQINEANHLIGHCIEYHDHIEGTPGKPNYGLAYKYFLKGAEKGHVECMLHVAAYNSSSNKITGDNQLAQYWYKKACDASSKEGCEALAKINSLLAKNSENSTQNTANAKPKSTDYLSVLEAIKKNL